MKSGERLGRLLTIHPFTLSNAYTLTAEVEAYASGPVRTVDPHPVSEQ